MIKLLIGAIIAGVIVVVSFAFISPLVSQYSENTTTVTDTSSSFVVSVEGEVSKTGTYTLSEGVTMNGLIQAAGGLTTNADARSYNTDFVLTSGMTYYIGSLYDAVDVCNNSEISKVNINSDGASELTAINGFTTSIAESVVSYRTSNGEFKCLEDLLNVYGIGNATYRKVRNFCILHE